MIGFITTPEISEAITAGIRAAQESRELPVVWLLIGMPIFEGDHIGKHFIPADDQILSTVIREDFTAKDFPEFETLISILGGLDARVQLDASAIINPENNITDGHTTEN